MNISTAHIKPSYTRKPYNDGVTGEKYSFKCPSCLVSNEIEFGNLLQSAWNWKDTFSKLEIIEIEKLFDIGGSGRSHDGGWPAINIVTCKECNEQYLSYVGVNEYSNSAYRLTEQGLVNVKT